MVNRLDNNLFASIVAYTPLVSVDLVVRNIVGEVLLGRRLNRPAQGVWFVPGGRIFKDEKLAKAFERITQEEIGHVSVLSSARQLGIYEHHYADSVFGDHISTHYIVLGFELKISSDIEHFPNCQHDTYRWFSVDELLASPLVHENTKAYFRSEGNCNAS